MSLFISVINHNHDDMIMSANTLQDLAKKFTVILKSNTVPSPDLIEYCIVSDIHLVHDGKVKGFGANNNDIFIYATEQLGMKGSDYFLVLNPDVIIPTQEIDKLLTLATKYQTNISTVNLFKNREKTEYDQSIRKYPSIFNPLKTLLGIKRTDYYEKNKIDQPIAIEWAAGSFLLFKTQTFRQLNGFDEDFFMYFEDADICTRANKQGFTVFYFPQVEAIHLAQHNNRKLFSKHLLWYCHSSLTYGCRHSFFG